jgi:predicted DNA binding CopG/RHH family protein
MAKKKMPAFASESEEARWYAEHQDDLEDYMEVPSAKDAARFQKELGSLTSKAEAVAEAKAAYKAHLAKKGPSQQVPLRIPHEDLDLARHFASKKGIGHHTLMKSLIHEGLAKLQSDEQAAG